MEVMSTPDIVTHAAMSDGSTLRPRVRTLRDVALRVLASRAGMTVPTREMIEAFPPHATLGELWRWWETRQERNEALGATEDRDTRSGSDRTGRPETGGRTRRRSFLSRLISFASCVWRSTIRWVPGRGTLV